MMSRKAANSLYKPWEFVWDDPINSKQSIPEVKWCFDVFGGNVVGGISVNWIWVYKNAEMWGIKKYCRRILVMLGGTPLPKIPVKQKQKILTEHMF